MAVAFKCQSCGALEPAGAAGELDRPAACHICGRGVAFDPLTGQKSLVPENWAVLAELEAKEIRALGIDPADVEAPAAPAAQEG